ncbi:hypothetical protein [Streptomyces sp. VRA16 Mangrove soil]|uniref:hypothetical protein n=1 Tax=Streptomyces sp. VRA16 Mangrove soil TaxID=2817434 RepID=UPI001A9E8ADE|nr:hypothetical protein [Streptomyces sp. VRA16 Mangrove soil]MBO1333572.1 hypothetical protein [Streptomyces sp. VRA16 Mangrove soil]
MSPVEERSAVVMSQEDFEEMARHAMRTNEALRLEFIGGKLGLSGSATHRWPGTSRVPGHRYIR